MTPALWDERWYLIYQDLLDDGWSEEGAAEDADTETLQQFGPRPT